jgi:phytanoyl-CoA hydroxylase
MGLEKQVLVMPARIKINKRLMENSLDFYKKNGFLHIENFLPKEDVAKVLSDAKNIFLRQFKVKKYVAGNTTLTSISEAVFNTNLYRLFEEDTECLMNCGKQAQHLISLHQLSLNAKIIEMLTQLGIETPNISTRPVLFFNHPKLAKQKVFYKVDAHQDWRSMQGSLNAIVVWVPLIDIDTNLGALEIIPKSHLFGLRTNHIDTGFGMVALSEEENKTLTTVEVKAGDVLIFSSFLIHQSGENSSDAPRWSCHFRYNDLDESTFIERKFAHAYIYKPIEELLTKDFPKQEDVIKTYE